MEVPQEIIKKHKEILYPTIRMRAKSAGGSGTVVYSQKTDSGEVESYVLGCEHVVDGCIEIKETWESMLGRKVKKEHLSTVTVEPFRYNNYSRCIGGSATLESDIVAYDKPNDLVLVKLRDKENMLEHVANVFPIDSINEIHVFDRLYGCGAALGHPPISTEGQLMSMDDEIEDLKFYLSTAMSIFGHSGGSIYRYSAERDKYELVAVPARITVFPKGFFDFETVTWMGYGIPIDRIHKFLKDWCYDFIFDSKANVQECHKRREKKRADAKKVLERMYGMVEGSETGSGSSEVD